MNPRQYNKFPLQRRYPAACGGVLHFPILQPWFYFIEKCEKCPFYETPIHTLQRKSNVWYARIWDEESQKYKHSRSTGIPVEGKKERRYEAEEAARKLCEEFYSEKTTSTKSAPPHLRTKARRNERSAMGRYFNGLITVQHNSINGEGVKLPKYNSVRKVPITSDFQRLLDIARGYAKDISPNTFVPEYI